MLNYLNIILLIILDLQLLILLTIHFDEITIYDPQNDPRFSLLAERFISNNDLLSHKRKETELKRLQTPNLELEFEVKVKFQGLNPHPMFHVSKIEHKTSPAPFEVVHIEFERDLTQPTITYGKIIFCNPYSGLKYTSSFYTLYNTLYNKSDTPLTLL